MLELLRYSFRFHLYLAFNLKLYLRLNKARHLDWNSVTTILYLDTKWLQSYYYCTLCLLCELGCKYFNTKKKELGSEGKCINPKRTGLKWIKHWPRKPEQSPILSKYQDIWHQSVLRNEGKIAQDGMHQQLSGNSAVEVPVFGITVVLLIQLTRLQSSVPLLLLFS